VRKQKLVTISAVVALAFLTAGLDIMGVAGYRFGFVFVSLVLVATAVGVLAVGGSPGMARLWYLAAVVGAIAIAGLLVDRAPFSVPRLASEMDALPLPLYRVVEETRQGNSRCRPSCPVVTRIYAGPLLDDRGTVLDVANALQLRGYQLDIARAVTSATSFEARRKRVKVTVSAPTLSSSGERQVAITFRAS